MTTKENLIKRTINVINDNRSDLLNIAFIDLISADTNPSNEYRKENIETLKIWLKVLPETNIINKDYWRDKLNLGIEILTKEIKNGNSTLRKDGI